MPLLLILKVVSNFCFFTSLCVYLFILCTQLKQCCSFIGFLHIFLLPNVYFSLFSAFMDHSFINNNDHRSKNSFSVSFCPFSIHIPLYSQFFSYHLFQLIIRSLLFYPHQFLCFHKMSSNSLLYTLSVLTCILFCFLRLMCSYCHSFRLIFRVYALYIS